MTRDDFVALVKQEYPEYTDKPPRELMERIRNRLMQPGAAQIRRFLATHQVSTGLIDSWFQSWHAKKHADTAEANLRTAQAYHEADNLLRAAELDIPREILAQVKRMEFEKNFYLDKYRGEGDIDLEHARRGLLQAIEALETIRTQLFKLYEERAALRDSTDPAKDDKVALLNVQVRLLEEDFRERGHQTLSQAAARRPELEGVHEDPEVQGGGGQTT